MEQAQYTPSGKMGLLAIPAALVSGVLVAAVGGYLYQWVVYYAGALAAMFPLPILAFGFVIGATTALALTWGKARHVRAACMMGVVAGLLAVGFTHYLAYRRHTQAWADAAERRLERTLSGELPRAEAQAARKRFRAMRSMRFTDYVDRRVERGWDMGGHREAGFIVWAAWLSEALILCGLGGMLAATGATGPFCERCGEHAREARIGTIHRLDPVAVRGAATKRGIPGVLALEPGSGSADVVVTMSTCPRCRRTKFVSVTAVWIRPRKIQRPRARVTETMLANVIPTEDELQALAARFVLTRLPSPRA